MRWGDSESGQDQSWGIKQRGWGRGAHSPERGKEQEQDTVIQKGIEGRSSISNLGVRLINFSLFSEIAFKSLLTLLQRSGENLTSVTVGGTYITFPGTA